MTLIFINNGFTKTKASIQADKSFPLYVIIVLAKKVYVDKNQ